MSISGTNDNGRPFPERESGGILLAALAILLVAGTVSAGVAHLVSSSSEGSVNSLESEKALFAAESGRMIFSGEDGPECNGGSTTIGDNLTITCAPDACNDGRSRITGKTTNATHSICISLQSSLDPDDCEDPGSVDWSDPPACIAGNDWEPSDTAPGKMEKASGAILIDGDLDLQSMGKIEFGDGVSFCVTGTVRAGPGGGGGATADITLDKHEKISHCIGGLDDNVQINGVGKDDIQDEFFDNEDSNISQCSNDINDTPCAKLLNKVDWSYDS